MVPLPRISTTAFFAFSRQRGVEVRERLPVGAAAENLIAPRAPAPKKAKNTGFKFPAFGGLVGVYRTSMQTLRPARFVLGAEPLHSDCSPVPALRPG
jgi:hypothetical protein